jgi:hypothetical protein
MEAKQMGITILMLRAAASTLFLVTIALACKQEKLIYITLENTTPQSFSVSGQAEPLDFQIMELPRTKPLSKTDPYSLKGKAVWKISAPGRMKAVSWPAVTYGVVPSGFSQIEPKQGSARKLAEQKLYVAQFFDGDEAAALFFEVRKGKLVNVTNDVFGP